MNPQDYQIFSHFAALVRERFPDARIWAFGSRAKGTATQESDLDVCVVLQTLNETIAKQIRYCAWEVGFEHDLVIALIRYRLAQADEAGATSNTLSLCARNRKNESWPTRISFWICPSCFLSNRNNCSCGW